MEKETRKLSDIIMTALRDKGLNLAKLSIESGVSERYLENLIEEKYESLPSSPYVRGYLLKIAEVLGVDGEALWREYLKDNETIRRSGKHDELPPNRFALPKIPVKIIIIGLVIILAIIFFIIRLPFFGTRGSLELISPVEETTVVENPAFLVSGKINPNFNLSLNGERVYPASDGRFEKTIMLQEGFNTLVFSFKKLLTNEQTLTRQVFYRKIAVNPEI